MNRRALIILIILLVVAALAIVYANSNTGNVVRGAVLQKPEHTLTEALVWNTSQCTKCYGPACGCDCTYYSTENSTLEVPGHCGSPKGTYCGSCVPN